MTFDEEFIVLHHTKINDSTVVIHVLGRTLGRRSLLASTSKGHSMALFLPMNILEGEVVENRQSSLWRVRKISALNPLGGIRSDIKKNTVTMFLGEVLLRTLKEGTSEDGLYQWCVKELLTLDGLEEDYANFHLKFLLDFCGALGFAPQAQDLLPFAGENYAKTKALLEAPFAEAMIIGLSGSERSEIASGIIRYLSFHTESSINVKSLDVLHALMSSQR